MRTKVKVTSREEILRNFTRDFLIEEKKRCEMDRYVTDFRILIHNRPHENHNYLNRLLQDYTSIFLSHERISANKMNEEEMKYQLKTHVASRKKDSPKQRYVKSKLTSKSSESPEHQSYLVLKAKTEEFLKKLRNYEQLEQLAYEIFINHDQHSYNDDSEAGTVLKLKSNDIPGEIPYKKYYRNVYVVNSPNNSTSRSHENIKSNNKLNSPETGQKVDLFKNHEFVKNETIKFLENNRVYNDAERKILSEQYRNNVYIKKYVDTLMASPVKIKSVSPKKGIFSKIKNMIGYSPETSTKFYKVADEKNQNFIEETRALLKNEKRYNSMELQAYRNFYKIDGKFKNPLIATFETIDEPDYTRQEVQLQKTSNDKSAFRLKNLVGITNNKASRNTRQSSITKSPKSDKDAESVEFQFEHDIPENFASQPNERNIHQKSADTMKPNSNDKASKLLREKTKEFLEKQKIYDNQQKIFYDEFIQKNYLPLKSPVKKESLLSKIKHFFKFSKNEKHEKAQYFKELTDEFVKNEQYYNSVIRNDLALPANYEIQNVDPPITPKLRQSKLQFSPDKMKKRTEKRGKSEKREIISPIKLHRRSKSEDLLTFRTKNKSVESMNRRSPTNHKTFSDRLKSMVGIGNKQRTKSRENILRLTDPVQYFLDHERFNYDIDPAITKKYNRSISLNISPGNTDTIKTKTKRFLSTENVLYQDLGNGLSSKPPSGRRRKEKRNEKDKDKRRSRTLSPAQKLVSKIRNIVSKDNKRNEKAEENIKLVREQTEKFMIDHKRFNDMIKEDALKHPIYTTENKNLNNSPETVSLSKSTPPKPPVKNEKQAQNMKKEEKLVPLKSDMSRSSKKIEVLNQKTLKNEKPSGNDKSKTQKTSNSSKIKNQTLEQKINNIPPIPKDTVKSKDGTNIFENPEFIRSQTRIFLHEIRKYHDLDKEPNTVDKTLIFINNKSESEPSTKRNLELNDKNSTETKITKDINKTTSMGIEKNASTSSTSQNSNISRTIKSELTETSSENMNELKNFKTINSAQKSTSSTNTIESKTVHKTTRQETQVTRKIVSETIQKKSYTIPVENAESNILEKISESNFTTTKHGTTSTTNFVHDKKDFGNISHPTFKDKSIEIHQQLNSDSLKKSSDALVKNETGIITLKNAGSMINNTFIREQNPDRSPKQKQNHEISTPIATAPRKAISKEFTTTVNTSNEVSKIKKNEFQPIKEQTKDANQYEIHKNKTAFKPVPAVQSTKVSRTNENMPKVRNEKIDEELKKISQMNTQENEREKKLQQPHKPDTKSNDKKIPNKNIEAMSKTYASKPDTDGRFLLLKQQTKNFLNDHQNYHNQEIQYNKYIMKHKLQNENQNLPSSNKMKDQKNIKTINLISERHYEQIPQIVEEKREKSLSTKPPEENKILRNQTEDFLKRHQYFIHKDEMNFNKNRKNRINEAEEVPKKEITNNSKATKVSSTIQSKPNEEDNKFLRLKNQTSSFLTNHQMHHNDQWNEEMIFFNTKNKSHKEPGIQTKPLKEKKTIITKMKNLLTPHKNKGTNTSAEDEINRHLKNATEEFLKKHQYSIHKEELNFTKPANLETSPIKEDKLMKQNIKEKHASLNNVLVKTEKDTNKFSIIKQQTQYFLANHQKHHHGQWNEEMEFINKKGKHSHEIWLSTKPIKDKGIVTKVKELFSPQKNENKKQKEKENNDKVLRDQTMEFLQKHQYLIHKDELNFKKVPKIQTVKIEERPIVQKDISTRSSAPKIFEQTKEINSMGTFLLSRQQTESFLQNHIQYHKHQQKEENDFLKAKGKSHGEIWLAFHPMKEKKNILTKIKGLLQTESKNKETSDETQLNKILRNQTEIFLKKHQYLIDRDEINFKKFIPVADESLSESVISKEKSVPKLHFSTTKNEGSEKFHVIKQQTESFLKNHQDYHHLYSNEEANFTKKYGKPVEEIWLSNRPTKEKKTILTKMRKLLTPYKNKNKELLDEKQNNKLLRDQTAEFLKKHQYLIHKDETNFDKYLDKNEKKIIIKEKISERTASPSKSKNTLVTAEDYKKAFAIIKEQTESFLQNHQFYHHDQRREENDFLIKKGKPHREIWIEFKPKKEKKTIIKKVKDLFNQKDKNQPDAVETNKLLRDQTSEFLEKHQYLIHKNEIDNIGTLTGTAMKDENSIQKKDFSNISSSITQKSSTKNKEMDAFPILKQQTKEFLTNHQDYHHSQWNEEIDFKGKTGKPLNVIWLASKPVKEKDNILTRVKNLWSSQNGKDAILKEDKVNKLLKDQTSEFLKKHQYLIHREEVNFIKESGNNIKTPETYIKIENQSTNHSAPAKKTTTDSAINSEESIFKILKQNTDNFLIDHQNYHHRQRQEELNFLNKINRPINAIWLSQQPLKEKKSMLTKVKKLLTSQKSKPKEIIEETQKNKSEEHKILKDQTEEFLKKHQYLIHRDEINFLKSPENKSKSIETSIKTENKSLNQSTPAKKTNVTTAESTLGSERSIFQIQKQNTENFLADHQNYHRRQRQEELNFLNKINKPIHEIWLSQDPVKEKKSVLTKVKKLLTPQKSKPKEITEETQKNKSDENSKILKDQTQEFLQKHQYLIHRDELNFLKNPENKSKDSETYTKTETKSLNQSTPAKKSIIPTTESTPKSERSIFKIMKQNTENFLIDHQNYHQRQRQEELNFLNKINKPINSIWLSSDLAKEKQNIITQVKKLLTSQKSKPKDVNKETQKSKAEKERYVILRDQTQEFLKNQQYLIHKDEITVKKPTDKIFAAEEVIKPKNLNKNAMSLKPQVPSEDNRFSQLKQATDSFLINHQEYHHRQWNDEVDFKNKSGKKEIWLSSKPIKEKKNIITKVKNLLSSPKNKNDEKLETEKFKLERDQTADFLKRHQYLIHHDEVNLLKGTTLKGLNAEIESKSKLSSLQSAKIDKKEPSPQQRNKTLRDQTTEFLQKHQYLIHKDELNLEKKSTEKSKNSAEDKIIPQKISDENTCPSQQMTSEHREACENNMYPYIKQQTDSFLKNHQDYHNGQRIEDVNFLKKHGSSLRGISLDSKPLKPKKNIITKVKNLLTSQKDVKVKNASEKVNSKFLRDKTEEFLKNHQYSIYQDEVDFSKYQTGVDDERIPKLVSRSAKNASVKTNQAKQDATITNQFVANNDKNILPIVKQQTESFLINHQNYHQKQWTEELNFIIKRGEPPTEIWLATKSATRNNNSITKEKDLVTIHKDESTTSANSERVSQNQTEESPRKVYFDEDTKIANQSVQRVVPLAASDESQLNPKIVHSKTKEKIKQKLKDKSPKQDNFVIMKQNTESFLTDHQNYHHGQRKHYNDFSENYNKGHNRSSIGNKNTQTSTKVTIREKLIPVHTTTAKETLVQNYAPSVIPSIHLIPNAKQLTDAFLKDHQDYHNKERHQNRKIEKEVTLEKPNKKNVIRKMQDFLFPDKKSAQTSVFYDLVPENDASKNFYIKHQTDQFLQREPYMIHKEEVTVLKNPKSIRNPDMISKQTMAESESPRKKVTFVEKRISIEPEDDISDILEAEKFQVLVQQTDEFLKDHQQYHSIQWKYYSEFLASKKELPEDVPKAKSMKKPIITKVKSLFASTNGNKKLIGKEEKDFFKVLREESDEFLKRQQYHIHKDEILNNSAPQTTSKIPEKFETKKVISSVSSPLEQDNKSLQWAKETQEFLKQQSIYDDIQWNHYQNFLKKHKLDDNNTIKKQNIEKPILSKITSLFSRNKQPQTEKASNNEIDGKKIRENTKRFLDSLLYNIHKEELIFNKPKPKPTPRKSIKANLSTPHMTLKDEQNSREKYEVMISNLRVFLEDHQNHHNKERQEHINYASDQVLNQKPVSKYSLQKEPKTKTKFLSKLRSLVGGSTEAIPPEKVQKLDALLKKQTLEFLISQKCYNDLEGDAALKFSKKSPDQVPADVEYLKIKQSKDVSPVLNAIPNKTETKQSVEKLSKATNEIPETKPVLYYEKKLPTHELQFLMDRNKVFLNDHKNYHDEQKMDFIAFDSKQKQRTNVSPDNIRNQNNKPQVSSETQKKIKMDNYSNMKTGSISTEKVSIKPDQVVEASWKIHCQDFLDSQRYHIDNEMEKWKQYIKYKPEAAVIKKSLQQTEIKAPPKRKIHLGLAKVQEQTRKTSSQIESDAIDHQIILHKTAMFLEHHKKYHDNLHNDNLKYLPESLPIPKAGSEQLVKEKKEGVLTKIKSFLPSAQNKGRSYDVQKAEQSILKGKQEDHLPVIIVTKLKNTELTDNSADESEKFLRNQTNQFLRDHQDYHNKERAEAKVSEEQNFKEKKPKKGKISKLISLIGGEQSKNRSSGELSDRQTEAHQSSLATTPSNDSFQIGELDSSPVTFKRIRVKNEQTRIPQPTNRKSSSKSDLTTVSNTNLYESPIKSKNEDSTRQSTSIKESVKKPNIDSVSDDIEKSGKLRGSIDSQEFSATTLSANQSYLEDSNVQKKYARDKIHTLDFLLNEKQFNNMSINDINSQRKNEMSSVVMEHQRNQPINDEHHYENVAILREKIINDTSSVRSASANTTEVLPLKEGDIKINESIVEKRKHKFLPSAPSLDQCEPLSEETKRKIEASVIHRVVSPISPTKTIFKEIRTRENSPDRTVYMISEGYMIKKEYNTQHDCEIHSRERQKTVFTSTQQGSESSGNGDILRQEKISRSNNDPLTQSKIVLEPLSRPTIIYQDISTRKESTTNNISDKERSHNFLDANDIRPDRITGQGGASRSRRVENQQSPSQQSPQGELQDRRQTNKSCFFMVVIVLVVIFVAIYLGREDEDKNY